MNSNGMNSVESQASLLNPVFGDADSYSYLDDYEPFQTFETVQNPAQKPGEGFLFAEED